MILPADRTREISLSFAQERLCVDDRIGAEDPFHSVGHGRPEGDRELHAAILTDLGPCPRRAG